MEDLERVMGRFLYGSVVLGLRLEQFLFAIKFYRRGLAAAARLPSKWTSALTPPPCVLRDLTSWQSIILANNPVTPNETLLDDGDSPTAVLATDATPNSFGGVLLRAGFEPVAFGGNFGFSMHINLAEIAAAYIMLLRFAEDLAHSRLLLLIDNTSTISRVLRAARGGCIEPHRIATCIIDLANAYSFKIRVQYIASNRNPADAVSRQQDLDFDLCHLALSMVDEARGRQLTRKTTRVGVVRRAAGGRSANPP